MLASFPLLNFSSLPEFKIITTALKQGEEQTFAIWLKIPHFSSLRTFRQVLNLGLLTQPHKIGLEGIFSGQESHCTTVLLTRGKIFSEGAFVGLFLWNKDRITLEKQPYPLMDSFGVHIGGFHLVTKIISELKSLNAVISTNESTWLYKGSCDF